MLIGDIDESAALLCRSDNPMGINNSEGDWFAPDGTRMGAAGASNVSGFYTTRGPMVVRLWRNNGSAIDGIYSCKMANESAIFIGLYAEGKGNMKLLYIFDIIDMFSVGNISLPGGMTVSIIVGASPQFTLTCISTGGPATTVSWTRDSIPVAKGTQTVLNDPVTAQYTNTLTVTRGGSYTCTVQNDKPSSDSASMMLEGRKH